MRIFVFQSAATADEQISDMNIENYIEQAAARAVERLYPQAAGAPIQIQRTRREFEGDYTLVVFPLLKASRKAPEATAAEIGEALVAGDNGIESYNVVKGFLNMTLRRSFWNEKIAEIASDDHFGYGEPTGRTVMVEYSSPNTNKPLHLGHIRNNLLGYSVAEILKACGNRVIKANLVNDRGIHICKSMLAWQKFGGGETPASSGMKGDHLVGKYYVEFDRHYKEEVRELVAQGQSEEEAKRNAPIMREAQEMLRRWEAKEPETYALWETMNGWVYDGFDKTYAALGIDFDMTQDLGTAYRRFEDNRLDELIYVVGNEQNYHFQVLKLVLKKLGYEAWSDHIFHLSYGMVELPEGKMKSREGTVVDADDLIEDMVSTAMEMSRELGKLDDATPEEAADISRMVGLGALKYFILKVDPKKTMLFDPRESIDFNGNTGPFIQYTHARICSVLRKAGEAGIVYANDHADVPLVAEEIELIKTLDEFPATVRQAGDTYSPSVIANYIYDLAKSYNGYYHDHSILREENEAIRAFRLRLSCEVARVIRRGMRLLGIEVPERM